MDERTAARAEVLRASDFMGWTVSDPSGSKVGTVSDLLLDRSGQVRYLAVKPGRHPVLVPVDALEWGEGTLVLTRWTEDDLKRLPPYDPDHALTPEILEDLERAYPRYYGREAPPPLTGDGPHIVPLKEAKEFQLPKEEPDVRGWNVFGSDGERVGTVAEMLVDPAAMKIRYLDVDLADDLFPGKDKRHVLVPLDHAELRARGKDVWVGGLGSKQIARLPAHTGGAVDPYVAELVNREFG